MHRMGKIEYREDGVMVVSGEEYIERLCRALSNSTRVRIMELLLSTGGISVSEIASKLGRTKADTSLSVRLLDHAGLVNISYKPGVRGIKKIVEPRVREIRIVLGPPQRYGEKA